MTLYSLDELGDFGVFDSIQEAVVCWLDMNRDLRGPSPSDTSVNIEKRGALTLYKQEPAKVTEAWVISIAGGLTESLAEAFHDHFGHPEAPQAEPDETTMALLALAVKHHCKQSKVECCEPAGTIVLSAEEIIKLLGLPHTR